MALGNVCGVICNARARAAARAALHQAAKAAAASTNVRISPAHPLELLLLSLWQLLPIFLRKPLPPLILMELLLRTASLHLLLLLLLFQEETCHLFPLIKLKPPPPLPASEGVSPPAPGDVPPLAPRGAPRPYPAPGDASRFLKASALYQCMSRSSGKLCETIFCEPRDLREHLVWTHGTINHDGFSQTLFIDADDNLYIL